MGNRTTLAVIAAMLMTVADDAVSQDDSSSGSSMLEEIIVTAQFREESAQDAAIAMDVVGVDSLERAGVSQVSQLTTLVPALQINSGGKGTQAIYVRGVGTPTANTLTEPGVAFNVDGVYYGQTTAIHNTFYDLARVEVLKGPQGTLYGRNATGGAINVIPVLPEIGEWGGYISPTVGNYGALNVEGAVNMPLSDATAARISFVRTSYDGYLSDDTSDADDWAIRAQLLIEPNDNLNFRISADFTDEGGNGTGSTVVGAIDELSFFLPEDAPNGIGGTMDYRSEVAPFDRSVGLLSDVGDAYIQSQAQFGTRTPALGFAASGEPYVDSQYWGIKGELNWQTELGAMTAILAHRESDVEHVDYGIGFTAYSDQSDEQTTFEVRLAGDEGGVFSWLIGAYYFDESIRPANSFNTGPLYSIQPEKTINNESWAAFARLTLAPRDDLRFVFGARYTEDDKSASAVNSTWVIVCDEPAGELCFDPVTGEFFIPLHTFSITDEDVREDLSLDVRFTPDGVFPAVWANSADLAANLGDPTYIVINNQVVIDEQINDSKVTWRAGIEYDISDTSLLYATVETGYHAGGFSFHNDRPIFAPEEITAYTIGSKNDFLDGTMRLNAELFHWVYENQQLTHFATQSGGGQAFVTDNAAESTNQGAEVSMTYLVSENTVLTAAIQYLDATYDDFAYDSPVSVRSPVLTVGCDVTNITADEILAAAPDLIDATVDCSGRDSLHAPEWTMNLGIQQMVPLGSYELIADLNTHYQTEKTIGFEMVDDLSFQDAYWMTNFALTLAPDSGNWSVTAFINNIEDERPLGSSFLNSGTTTFAGNPLPPRLYGVRARFEF